LLELHGHLDIFGEHFHNTTVPRTDHKSRPFRLLPAPSGVQRTRGMVPPITRTLLDAARLLRSEAGEPNGAGAD
jgi:hypothetical protein